MSRKKQRQHVAVEQTVPAPAANKKNEWFYLAGALFLAAVLLFTGLGKHYFWDDEANTAVMGQNMVATGSTSAWNGRNLLSYGMAGTVNVDMKKNSAPPVQYIVAGIGQKIVGQSTGGLRFIFSLFGLGAVLFTALWYREEFGYRRWWLPAYFLALSVPFILYSKQVRYYPLCLFFSFALMYLWAKMPKAKYPWLVGGLAVISGGLLAATHYLFAGAIGLVIAITMCRPYYRNRRNVILLGIFVGCTVMAALLVHWYSPGMLGYAFNFSAAHLQSFAHWLERGLIDSSIFEFIPFGMLLFAAVAFFMKKTPELKKLGRDYGFVWIYMALMLAGCAFFSPQPGLGRTTDMRYYIDLIPLGAVASALTFEILAQTKQKWLPWAFGAMLVSSNLLYLNFVADKHELHCRLYQYLAENIKEYPSTGRAVEAYISKNIKPDECLFMVPLYNNIIQMFYHPEQKFCGLVSNTANFARKHKAELREDLFFETSIPDYFLVGNRNPKQFQELLNALYGSGTYQLAEAIPVYWKEATRPEIPWRRFEPVKLQNGLQGGTLVFKRTAVPAHQPTIPARQIEKYIKY